MALIVCVACVKSKRSSRCRVEDLYTSPLFRLSLAYAKSLNPDQIVILSAKHGMLQLGDEVEPYEQILKTMAKSEQVAWASMVLDQLKRCADLENDAFVLLAPQRYRENLVPHLRHYSVHMEGLRQGEQRQWLNERVAK